MVPPDVVSFNELAKADQANIIWQYGEFNRFQKLLCSQTKSLLLTWLFAEIQYHPVANEIDEIHRIRGMVANQSPEMLKEEVQVDETFVQGKDKNRHANKMKGYNNEAGMVFGALETGGKIRTKVLPNVTGAELKGAVREFVHHGSIMVK